MTMPLVVYADFESFTKPIDGCIENPTQSYTNKYQHYKPSGFCYYIKYFDDNLYKREPVIYTPQSEDENVAEIFLKRLEADIREIYEVLCFQNKKIIMTKQLG
jgi:hypothetical protein